MGLARRGQAVRETRGAVAEEQWRDLGLLGAVSSEWFPLVPLSQDVFFSRLWSNSVVKSRAPTSLTRTCPTIRPADTWGKFMQPFPRINHAAS